MYSNTFSAIFFMDQVLIKPFLVHAGSSINTQRKKTDQIFALMSFEAHQQRQTISLLSSDVCEWPTVNHENPPRQTIFSLISRTHQYPSYERTLTHRALFSCSSRPSHPGERGVTAAVQRSGTWTIAAAHTDPSDMWATKDHWKLERAKEELQVKGKCFCVI